MSFDLHGTARTARNKTAAQKVKRAKAVGEEGMKYMADQDLVAIWLITPPETEKGASVRKMLSYTKMERYEPENEEHRRLRDRIEDVAEKWWMKQTGDYVRHRLLMRRETWENTVKKYAMAETGKEMEEDTSDGRPEEKQHCNGSFFFGGRGICYTSFFVLIPDVRSALWAWRTAGLT